MLKLHTIALISHASKIILKSFKLGFSSMWTEKFHMYKLVFNSYVNQELLDVQFGFRRGRGTRDQIANICWILEKVREFQENIYFCFFDYTKAFDCVDHKKPWKILKEMEISDHLHASFKICMQVKKQQLEQDTEKQTDSKLGWEFVNVLNCHLAYLTYMQSTSFEMPSWMKHKLESVLTGKI